jgi:hypothetical protein
MGTCWGLTKMPNFQLKKSSDTVSLHGKKYFRCLAVLGTGWGSYVSTRLSSYGEVLSDLFLNFVLHNFVLKINFRDKPLFFICR